MNPTPNDRNGLAWIAEIVFLAAFFISWASGELVSGKPTDIWLAIAAWAALITAVCLAFWNGRHYLK